MIATDTLRLALRNLRQAKLRTALTTLGVAIGIASLAGMLSLGVGLQDQFVGRLLRSGVFDAVTVLPAPATRLFGGRGGPGRRGGVGGLGGQRAGAPAGGTPAAGQAQPRRSLDDEALKEIAAFDEVREVYPNLRVPVELRFDQFSEPSMAAGVPMSARDEGAFQTFAHGAFFTSDAESACLLSLDMARRLTEDDPGELIGRELIMVHAGATPGGAGGPADSPAMLQVRRVETPCRIAGIVERDPTAGFGGGLALSGLMIPLGKARELYAGVVTRAQVLSGEATGPRSYASATVKVKHARFTQDVEDRIKAMGLSAFSLNDALEGAKRAFLILDIVLSLIGSIALAVSSLGIVNTMVMSILERTREIGVMKAIGGSDGDIRRIFLVEASVIGLLGGLSGVALGWLVGRAINAGANFYVQSQGGAPGNLFLLPWWLVGGAIGFSVAVSLVAGSYPASRAAKLDPIQALRHD